MRAMFVTTILVIAILVAGFAVAGSIFVSFRSAIVPTAFGYLAYDRWTGRTVACRFPDSSYWNLSQQSRLNGEDRSAIGEFGINSWEKLLGASEKSSRAAAAEKRGGDSRPRCIELD